MIAMSTLLASCKKIEINRIEKNIVEGEWSIYSFIENGKDQTDSGYSEYHFDFCENGDVVARIPTLGVLVAGKWEVKKSEDKDVVFVMNMNYPLDGMNETWHVMDDNKRSITLDCTSTKGYDKHLVFNIMD
jgi:hypothetical protein